MSTIALLATRSQAATVAERGDLDAVARALTRLIEGMDPGSAIGPPPLRGTERSLAFMSTLPSAAALPTRQARLLLTLEGGRLVLRVTPRLPGERTAPSAAGATDTELLQGLQRLEVSYWTRGANPRWVASWTDRAPPRPDPVAPRVPGRGPAALARHHRCAHARHGAGQMTARPGRRCRPGTGSRPRRSALSARLP